jgi:hypothetical protein
MNRRLALLITIASTALPLAAPATAGASAYSTVYNAWSKTGALRQCEFPAATLSAALHETPAYDLQYVADFPDAVQGALQAWDAGVCAKSGSSSTLAAGTARQGSGGGPLPTSVRASTSSGAPLPIVVLAVLAGLLVIAGGWYSLARRRGTQSQWLADWRHACAEAQYRLSGRWADLSDRPRRRRRRRGPARA